MAENEALKEKVDILFKLGRSYIDNVTRKNENSKESEDNAEEDVIKVEEENIENLQAWTKNKMRGFKRATSASRATPKTFAPDKKKSIAPPTVPQPAPQTRPTPPPPRPAPPPAAAPESDNPYRGKYCHYFVNAGKCNYKERTGYKCKFEHKIAPMCNPGMNCSRTKCMFSHPKVNNFLGNTRAMNPMMNPWQLGQMINPWMTPPTNQFTQNPWNTQGSQH